MIVRPTRSKEATDYLYRKCDSIDVGPSLRMIEAVDENGKILGVIGFNCWMDLTCLVHIAVDSPTTFLPLACAGADYIFRQLCLSSIIGITRASKDKYIKGLQAVFGFKTLARIQGGGFQGQDLVILETKLSYCERLWKRIEKNVNGRRGTTPGLSSARATAS